MANANQADFFGEGVNAGPQASNYVSPDDQPNPANPGGISNNELARRRAALAQTSGAGGGYSSAPGKVTPGGGGSRTMFSGISNPFTVNNLKRGVAAVSTLGASELPGKLGLVANPVGMIGNQKYAQPAVDAGLKLAGIGQGGGAGGGSGGPAGDPTGRVESGSQAISNQLDPFIDDSGDRGQQALDEFYNTEKPENNTVPNAQSFADDNAVDPSTARNAEIDRAFEMSSDLVDRILNAPSQTAMLGDQALSSQLALGRSSPGGIGNVQAGVKAGMQAAPALQRDAMQASIQEQQARANAATGAAQIYAGVAQGTADRDVRIAESNQTAAGNVLGVMTQQYGMDLNYTTEEKAQLGQLSRDFYNNQEKFVGMDVEQQKTAFQSIVQIYGIKGDFAAAIAKIAADEGIGEMDAMKLVLGGVDAYMKYKTMGAV
jgi:hypothetical protein